MKCQKMSKHCQNYDQASDLTYFLFIQNIPRKFTARNIYDKFKQFLDHPEDIIRKVFLVAENRGPEGYSSGDSKVFCYIGFNNLNDAKKCWAHFDGTRLNDQFDHPGMIIELLQDNQKDYVKKHIARNDFIEIESFNKSECPKKSKIPTKRPSCRKLSKFRNSQSKSRSRSRSKLRSRSRSSSRYRSKEDSIRRLDRDTGYRSKSKRSYEPRNYSDSKYSFDQPSEKRKVEARDTCTEIQNRSPRPRPRGHSLNSHRPNIPTESRKRYDSYPNDQSYERSPVLKKRHLDDSAYDIDIYKFQTSTPIARGASKSTDSRKVPVRPMPSPQEFKAFMHWCYIKYQTEHNEHFDNKWSGDSYKRKSKEKSVTLPLPYAKTFKPVKNEDSEMRDDSWYDQKVTRNNEFSSENGQNTTADPFHRSDKYQTSSKIKKEKRHTSNRSSNSSSRSSTESTMSISRSPTSESSCSSEGSEVKSNIYINPKKLSPEIEKFAYSKIKSESHSINRNSLPKIAGLNLDSRSKSSQSLAATSIKDQSQPMAQSLNAAVEVAQTTTPTTITPFVQPSNSQETIVWPHINANGQQMMGVHQQMLVTAAEVTSRLAMAPTDVERYQLLKNICTNTAVQHQVCTYYHNQLLVYGEQKRQQQNVWQQATNDGTSQPQNLRNNVGVSKTPNIG